MSKKTWVTKYGYPLMRKEVEHDDGECPACLAVGGLPERAVCFVEVEEPDGTTRIRRVQGTGKVKGFFARLPFVVGYTRDELHVVECRPVSREEVERELAEARANGWLEED